MPKNPPSYLKNPVATTKGWANKKGELILRTKMTQEEVDAYNGSTTKKVERKLPDTSELAAWPFPVAEDYAEEPSAEEEEEVEEPKPKVTKKKRKKTPAKREKSVLEKVLDKFKS